MFKILFGKKETKEQVELRFQKRLILDELEKAKLEFKVAQSHFDTCSMDYFDVANRQLTIAKEKLDLAIVKSKMLSKVV